MHFLLHIDCTKPYNRNAHISQVICCPQLSCHNKSDTKDIFCYPYLVKELKVFSEGPWLFYELYLARLDINISLSHSVASLRLTNILDGLDHTDSVLSVVSEK